VNTTISHDGMIEFLWGKYQIEKVMIDLARAIDRGEWALYRRCLADEINVNFQRTTGFPEIRVNADLWTRCAELLLAPVRRHHMFSNFSVSINGDMAEATVYLVARHWKATDNGSSEFIQNGWYENRFARINGEWKITRLLHTHQWVSGNGALLNNSDPEAMKVMQQVFSKENCV
jgi:hypothetical protein